MMSIEIISMVVQGFIGFLLAYFAYDFLSEFKELRRAVTTLNISMCTVVDRLERIERDHGHRIERLETQLL